MAGGYRSIGPANGETIIGGVVSTDSYLEKGHQVDLEMLNLDSVINKAQQLVPDAGTYLTWQALKADWDKYYQANIATVPYLPVQNDADLDTWLSRVAQWKATAAAWAAKSSDASFAQAAANMPSSAAAITKQEDDAKPSALANPWVKIALVGGAFLGLGWLASSFASVFKSVRAV